MPPVTKDGGAPRDILRDGSGDWSFSNGSLLFATNAEAIAQDIGSKLQFKRGEWFLDLDESIPYYGTILVKNPKTPAIQSIFRKRIMDAKGTVAIESLTLDYDAITRALRVAFAVRCDTGLLASDTLVIK